MDFGRFVKPFVKNRKRFLVYLQLLVIIVLKK